MGTTEESLRLSERLCKPPCKIILNPYGEQWTCQMVRFSHTAVTSMFDMAILRRNGSTALRYLDQVT